MTLGMRFRWSWPLSTNGLEARAEEYIDLPARTEGWMGWDGMEWDGVLEMCELGVAYGCSGSCVSAVQVGGLNGKEDRVEQVV